MKKIFAVILGTTFLVVLLIISNFSNVNGQRVSYRKHNDEIIVGNDGSSDTQTTEPTQTVNTDKLTLIINPQEKNQVVYTDTVLTLDTLTFDKDVTILDLKKIDNNYVALGEKNNNPFMQEFAIENQKLVATSSPLIALSETGAFIDITKEDYYITATIEDQNQAQFSQKFIETNNTLIPFYKEHIQYNHYTDMTITPKYLVIHETANTAIGADAYAHYRYWNNNPTAYASTHFVVDNTQVYQMLNLDEAAWHVGDNHGYSDITNFNSIGIEIAVNADGNYTVARQNAIELTIQVMNSLHMNISQLKRHHDASGKDCPTNMLLNPELWDDFVAQVQAGLNQ